MRPKGKLLALVAMFAAVGLITATGAFTTVEAQRTADVSVSEDSAALLQLEPSDDPNGEYATGTGGTVQIDISQLNLEANTTIDNVINVTNQGTQSVDITVDDVSVSGASGVDAGIVSPPTSLNTGNSDTFGIYIDTSGASLSDGDSFTITYTITADASS
jgi:hypothetical protein